MSGCQMRDLVGNRAGQLGLVLGDADQLLVNVRAAGERGKCEMVLASSQTQPQRSLQVGAPLDLFGKTADVPCELCISAFIDLPLNSDIHSQSLLIFLERCEVVGKSELAFVDVSRSDAQKVSVQLGLCRTGR